MTSPATEKRESPSGRFKLGLIVAAIILAAVGVWLADRFAGPRILGVLIEWEVELRRLYREHPVATLAVAFLVYVVVTGLSLPGGLPMSLAYGWLFGFVPAVILVSFASTTGATVAFLLSRYFFRDWVQSRFGDRLAGFNSAMEKEGAFYLFTLRLIPQVPFFVINAVMGLTKIRVTTFWWVSQLGMLPGTCVFIWAGASVPSLKVIQAQGVGSAVNLNLLLALTALGLFPLVTRWAIAWWKKRTTSPAA